MTTCKHCQSPIEQPNAGRRRIWCSERCRKAHASIPPPPRTVNDTPVGPAVAALVDGLDDKDPRAVVGLLAILTARELDAQPGNVPLIRELRTAVTQLTASSTTNVLGEVDEERLKILRHRIASQLTTTAASRRERGIS